MYCKVIVRENNAMLCIVVIIRENNDMLCNVRSSSERPTPCYVLSGHH